MSIILIADDDEIFRAVTARHLSLLGFDVIEAPDGQRIEELISAHGPVACIIDIVMPEREGMGVLFDLRLKGIRESKLIAVSSNPRYLEIVKGEIADAVLLKAILPEALKKALVDVGVYSG